MIDKIIHDAMGKRYKIIKHYRNADEMLAEAEDGEQLSITAVDIAEGEYEVVNK